MSGIKFGKTMPNKPYRDFLKCGFVYNNGAKYVRCGNYRYKDEKKCAECVDRKSIGKIPQRFFPMKSNPQTVLDWLA